VSRETGLLLDIVNRNGRDAWAAVPITLIERSWIKPVAQASLSKVSMLSHDDIGITLCDVILTPGRKADQGDYSESNSGYLKST
jgi:hypothetical protein